jgi:transposase-like protein
LAFSGCGWPPDVTLTAIRCSAGYTLSAAHVMQLLAERHLDDAARPVRKWGQTFGPQLAKALNHHL